MKTAGLGAAALALPRIPLVFGEETKRPNVIFIMSDDHTSQAVSAYGGILKDVCPTPNIDRLANEGMLFTNCFVTNSICTPSRSAIMTGKYAHKNGVYKFTALDQSQPTLPKMMQVAGYHTALIGKYHLHSNPVGLDHYVLLPGQGDYHNPEFVETGNTHPSGWNGLGEMTRYEGHSSDIIADKTLEYLKDQRPADKPFMLFCHFKAPHDTWEYAERYEEFLADTEIPEPPTLFDDYDGRSEALKTQLQYIGSPWGDHTNFEEETEHLEGEAKKKMQYQLYMKKYLRCVKGVDDNVGRILDYLDESGLVENTLIMYTGDQGFFLGEHGMYDKRWMYEEALRMPFLVRWPDQIQPATLSDGMILNVDFAPTILAAAGILPDPGMQGEDFLPLTRGEIPMGWRDSMYYRYYYSHFESEPHYGVRTRTHKLIYFHRIDQWECYDLENDPHEMNNVYADPAYVAVVVELKQELERLQQELGDDPNNHGNEPDVGPLKAAPLFVTEDVSLGKGSSTVITRFKTTHGGTLFSHADLSKDISADDFVMEGFKALTVFRDRVVLYDGWEEFEIAMDLTDDRWHTLILVVKRRKARFYVDGEMIGRSGEVLSEDNAKASFNVGAGMSYQGYMGYNFMGSISNVLVYDEAFSATRIQKFDDTEAPSGKLTLDWKP